MKMDHYRPDWNIYFMSLALLISSKSIDKRTRHGTVVVNDDHTILSTGYNSAPRGCVDDAVPSESPEKYKWTIHSEINAISEAARQGVCLKDSTFYVTGFPCPGCLRSVINVGAKRLIYGPIGSHVLSDEDYEFAKNMIGHPTYYGNGRPLIELVSFGRGEEVMVKELFGSVLEYYDRKLNDREEGVVR